MALSAERIAPAGRQLVRCIVFIALALVASAAFAASYVYDANGRLRAVTADSGATAEYVYDALGNILAIDNVPAGQLAIFAFVPNHGPVGSTVTIAGQGFSTIAGNNALTFNGTAATVLSATTTQLVAQVPAGATTGALNVHVGSAGASSLDDFVVTGESTGAAPSIASFSPAVADSNTSVSVSGAGFAQGGGTQAGVNLDLASVTPASDTQLGFTPLSYALSGPVTVQTPYGVAQSTTPLIVVPTSVGAGNVMSSALLTVDGPTQPLNFSGSGKAAAAVFSAQAGQWLSLQFSQLTVSIGTVSVSVYDPAGNLFTSSVQPNNLSVHLPPTPLRGNYLVVLNSTNAATSQFRLGVESNPTLGTSAALPVANAAAGQSKRVVFAAGAGQNLGLGVTNMTLAPGSGNSFTARLLTPMGMQLGTTVCTPSTVGCEMNITNLPATQSYGLVFTPAIAATMGFTATLSMDTGAALAVDTPYALNIARPGQNGRMTFSPAAGQSFALLVGGASVTPSNTVAVRVLKPDGSTLAAANVTNGGAALDLVNLAPLTYTVFVDPVNAATATMSVTLSSGSGVSVNGAPKAFSTSNAGQSAYFQFNVSTAGQNLGLGLTGMSITPSSGNTLQVNVYNQNGTSFASNTCYPSNSGCELNLAGLAIGSYAVFVTPSAAATIGFTVTLSSDVTAALALDTPYALNLARAGQNGRLTFTATQDQYAGLLIGGANVTPSNYVLARVLKPDGSTLVAGNLAYGGAGFNLTKLPAGQYTVFVDPAYAATATMSVTLSSGGGLSVGGAPAHVATSNSGQPAYFQFSGTAGQNLGLGATGISFAPTSVTYFTLNVYKPDGVLWQSNTCFSGNAGCELNLPGLPATGVYTVVAAPGGAGTMAFNLSLSADLVVPLPSSTTTPMSLARNGQNGRYTFTASASSTSIVLSAIATTPANQYVTLRVQPSDNGTQIAAATTQTGYTFNLTNLTVGASYTVFVDPLYASMVNLSARRTP